MRLRRAGRKGITGLLLLCALAGAPAGVRAETDGSCRSGLFPFALELMERGRWEQAIQEFERFLFFCPDHAAAPEAELAIGRCYEQLGRYAEAVGAYRRAAERHVGHPVERQALYRAGAAAYRAGKYEEARIALNRLLAPGEDDRWAWRARYRRAWASLRLHAFVVAREQFVALGAGESPYREAAEALVAGIDRIRDLPYRSPLLAGVLSGVLPGSGQVYTGHYKDGLLAFLVNGGLIFATYEAVDKEVYAAGGLTGVVALTFYAGNVYGAVNSAYRSNHRRLDHHLGRLEKQYEWWGEDQ